MKKLSKMVLLLGSVFLLTLFASCSNGSSSDDSREPDTLLAGNRFGNGFNNWYLSFDNDGKSFKMIDYDTGDAVWEGTYIVEDGEKRATRTVYVKYVLVSTGQKVDNITFVIPAGDDGWERDGTVWCLKAEWFNDYLTNDDAHYGILPNN